MLYLGLLFTLAVLAVNLWGLMLATGLYWRNRWFALVSGPILAVTAVYAVECYHGLGPSLGLLGLLSTGLSAALIALSAGAGVPALLRSREGLLAAWRAEFAPRRVAGCLSVAAGIFLYALVWRLSFPDVNGSSEKIADFSYICSYYHGGTIPVSDDWLHPYLSTQYYSFQHYGAALLGRVLGLPTGTAYNLGFCTLIMLGGTAFAGTVFLAARRWWVRALVLAGFVVGGMGPTLLVHLTDREVNPWTSMRFIGSAPMDKAPAGTWLKAYQGRAAAPGQPLDLPGEPFSYSVYLGDYHPPLSGYYLLGLAALGMLLWNRYQRRRYAVIVGATVTWTLLANTWILPLQLLAVAGWLVVVSADWRRVGPAVAAGAAGVWLLAWSYLAPFTSAAAGYNTVLRPVPLHEHTPPLLLLIFLLPTLGLIVLALLDGLLGLRSGASRQGLRLGLLWFGLLAFSEAFYVDDIYSGVYDRFNTTLKWWPWIAAGTLMTLGPYVLEHATRRWIRWAGIFFCLYPCAYVYDLWKPLVTLDKPSFGRIEGTNYLTQNEFPRLMLGRLKVEPPGLAIERPEVAGSFTDSAVVPLFAGQRMWLGWYAHEQLWREFREDIRMRHDILVRFYNGTLPDAAHWLKAQNIDYVLWFRPGDTPDLWAKVNAAVAPDYLWTDILTYQGGPPEAAPRVGLWRRRPRAPGRP